MSRPTSRCRINTAFSCSRTSGRWNWSASGKSSEVCNIVLPFQVIEQVDEPRAERPEDAKRKDKDQGLALTFSCTGGFLALRDKLHHARGRAEQFEERLEGRKVPILGAFDVLELDQLVDAGSGQLRQVRGVELLAGNRKHQVPGIYERRQDHHGPLRLKPQRLRGHVLDAQGVLDQFGPVHHLAVTLFFATPRTCFTYFDR